MSEEMTLPSGAKLKIQISPFADSKALYQAVLHEMRGIPFSQSVDLGGLIKNVLCTGFSSPLVDTCLTKCFERCTIDGLKIDKDTFEKPERREDYTIVCTEVLKANVYPFMKSLFANYKAFLAILGNTQGS